MHLLEIQPTVRLCPRFRNLQGVVVAFTARSEKFVANKTDGHEADRQDDAANEGGYVEATTR
jgi:hypothetical protein